MQKDQDKASVSLSSAQPQQSANPSVEMLGRKWDFTPDEWYKTVKKERAEKYEELVAKKILTETQELSFDELKHLLKVTNSKMDQVYDRLRLNMSEMARWNNLDSSDLLEREQSREIRAWLGDKFRANLSSQQKPWQSRGAQKPVSQGEAKKPSDPVIVKKLDK